jgi:hypothetical protein
MRAIPTGLVLAALAIAGAVAPLGCGDDGEPTVDGRGDADAAEEGASDADAAEDEAGEAPPEAADGEAGDGGTLNMLYLSAARTFVLAPTTLLVAGYVVGVDPAVWPSPWDMPLGEECPVDECVRGDLSGDPPTIPLEDGGDIVLEGLTTGTVTLRFDAARGMYFRDGDPAAPALPPEAFPDSGELRFHGAGAGGLGAFDVRVPVPGEPTGLQPAEFFDGTGSAEHPAAEDLVVRWDAGGGGAAIAVTLVSFGTMKALSCRATDDGEFAVPASDLATLGTGPVTITVLRGTELAFDVAGADVALAEARIDVRGAFTLR